jgi:hypothetical protein
MKLKYRKTLFICLITALAGGSSVLYGNLTGDLLSNLGVMGLVQQIGAVVIYLICFGPNLTDSRSPFE